MLFRSENQINIRLARVWHIILVSDIGRQSQFLILFKLTIDVMLECEPYPTERVTGDWTAWSNWSGCDFSEPAFQVRYRVCLNDGPFFNPIATCKGDEAGLTSFFEKEDCPIEKNSFAEIDGNYDTYASSSSFYASYSSSSS